MRQSGERWAVMAWRNAVTQPVNVMAVTTANMDTVCSVIASDQLPWSAAVCRFNGELALRNAPVLGCALYRLTRTLLGSEIICP